MLDKRCLRSELKSEHEAYLLSTLKDHVKSGTSDLFEVCEDR